MLTAGALQRVAHGDTSFNPHIQVRWCVCARDSTRADEPRVSPSPGRARARSRQVIDIKKMNSGQSERFRLVVSDGGHHQQSMLATQLNSVRRDARPCARALSARAP